MKFTRTETFVEIVETVTVRMTDKQSKSEPVLDPQRPEQTFCPFCGSGVPEVKELEKGE